MCWNLYVDSNSIVVKIDSNKKHLFTSLTQEHILAFQLGVDIHQIEEDTFRNSLLLAGYLHSTLMYIENLFLLGCQLLISSSAERVNAPVIKDCCTSVVAAEALLVHTVLTIFLTSIKHEWVLLHQQRGYHSRHTFHCIGSKEIAGYTLLVMVLKEIEHVVTNIVGLLPSPCNG